MLRGWWARHGPALMRLAVAIMAVAALLRLGFAFWRLLWDSGRLGAIDLRFRHTEVNLWFAGKPVYGQVESAVYPPATYALLWPILGWLPVTQARWLWGATTVIALGWLAYLLVRESGARTPLERLFIALLVFSIYPTRVIIGIGQLGLHLFPPLLSGLVLLQRRDSGWRKDLLAAALLLWALVKPSVSAPFFWIVFFVPDKLRPFLLVSIGYIALTLFAASFQEGGLATLFVDKMARTAAYTRMWGYANLHIWLASLGLQAWALPASGITLLVLGLWTYLHRRVDPWLLISVAAIVARFWTTHGFYDDLLILLPAVALFRLAKGGSSADGGDMVAGGLFAITVAALLGEARILLFVAPWDFLFKPVYTIIWISVLIFLLDRARRDRGSRAESQ
jgi:hypothetical protein